MTAIAAVLLVSAVFLSPLAWRMWRDARQERADTIGADVRTAVNRRLRGESLVSVAVAPPLFWRAGRIVLSAPAGYECLVEAVWPDVVNETPAGYEVVLAARALPDSRATRESDVGALPRAA
jgi:hypothetical protein